jgi:hypothetical protein
MRKRLGDARLKILAKAIAAQCYNGARCPGPSEDHGCGDFFSECTAYGVWNLVPKGDHQRVLDTLKAFEESRRK